MNYLEIFKSGSGIHIKKKNRGKFTKSAKAAGESVQEHAHKVMNDPNATALQKKRANFAIQAKKWSHKHQDGGTIKSNYDSASLNETNRSLNIPEQEVEIPDYITLYKTSQYPLISKKKDEYTGTKWSDITITPNGVIRSSYTNSTSLADRNNNPLNIRLTSDMWQGQTGSNKGFVSFKDIAYGYRAGFKNIANQIKKGNNTLQSLINVWAPASDGNNPVNYAKFVSEKTGIGINDRLDPTNKDQMIKLVAAMAHMESGHPANISDIESGWNLLS